MNTALVLEHMDPTRGGCEAYTARLAVELAAREHRVTVFCWDARWSCEGVTVRQLPGGKGIKAMRRFERALADELAAGSFDVAHGMIALAGLDVYQPHGGTIPERNCTSLRKRAGLGRLGSRLGNSLSPRRRASADREARLVADENVVCLCVSDLVAEQFRRHYGRAGNVVVAHNAAPAPAGDANELGQWHRERRAEFGIADDETVFLTPATHFEAKGVDFGLRALARWSGAGGKGRLVAVGDDRGARRLAGLARSLGIADRAILRPYDPQLPRWYAAADVLMLLTWYDSCSLTVLEAAAYGVPSITTRYNGAVAALQGGVAVVPGPRDLSAVVEAMAALSVPAARVEMGRQSRQAVEGLTWDRHVGQVLDVYRRVVARRGA